MLTSGGTTTYRTLLAGDAGNDIAVDSNGQVFIASGRYDEDAGNVDTTTPHSG